MKSIMDKLKDILPGSDKEKEEKTPAGPEAQEQAESPAEPEKADAAAAEEARSVLEQAGGSAVQVTGSLQEKTWNGRSYLEMLVAEVENPRD